MAEHSFQEVVRQWKRMCKTHSECDGCPVDKIGCSGNVSALTQPEQTEKAIMSWAAEHPEPVYPSWMEYIMDVQPDCVKAYNSGNDALWKWMCTTPIPADKAQKLGIEPKEGT